MSSSSKRHTIERLSQMTSPDLVKLWHGSKNNPSLRRYIKHVIGKRKEVVNFLKA